MQGARFVETNLVQKMLRSQQYDFHKKKLDEINTEYFQYEFSKKARYAFKDLPVLSKTQQLKAQSSRFQKSEERKRIDEQNQFLTSHIIEIQEGKNSQFRTIWTVSNFRQKPYVIRNVKQADTSQWCDSTLGKRLHSPLRRKQQQKIDEENQEIQKRLELTKQILLEKQQEQIQRYEKLRDHMTRVIIIRNVDQRKEQKWQDSPPTLNEEQKHYITQVGLNSQIGSPQIGNQYQQNIENRMNFINYQNMSSGFTHYKVETTDTYQRNRPDDYKIQVEVTDQGTFQKILEAKEREITNLRESVKSLNNQITDYLKELDMWKNKYKQLQSEKGTSRISSMQTGNEWEVQQLREEINRLKLENRNNFQIQQPMNNDFELNSLRQQIKQLQEELRMKNQNYQPPIPTQSYNMNTDALKEQIKQLAAEKEDLIKANNLLNQQASQLKLQSTTIRTTAQPNDDMKIKIKLYEDKISEQQQEIQRLNYNCDSYIQEIQQSQLRYTKPQNSEIEGYLRRISALQHEVLQWQDRCRALELQVQSSETEQKVGQKDNQILFLQERTRQYELQIEQLRLELDRSRKENDGYRISFESRKTDTAEVEQLRRKIAEMEQDILILISDLQEREQRISITEQGQAQYQMELNQLREEKERFRMDFERISSDYQRQSDQFRNSTEVDTMRQRIIELETQVRNQQYQQQPSQNQQLQYEFQQLTSQCNKYKYDYEQLYNELMQIKQTQIEKNSYQFVNIQSDYQALQDRYNQSLNEITQLNEQIKKYRGDYDQLNQNFLIFQRESEAKSNQTDQIRKYEIQIQQLRQQLQQQESSLEQQFMERLRIEKYQIESRQGVEFGQLKQQFDQLQLRYSECQSELRLAKETTTRQSQYESQNLRDQLQQLRQINLQLNSDIKGLQEQISKYRTDYEQVNQHFILLQRESETFKKNTVDQDRFRALEYELQQKNQQINKLQIDLQNQSVQIKSDLEQQFVSRLTIERSNLENRLQQSGQQEISQLQQKLQISQSELNQLRQRYSQIEQQYNQTRIEITQIKQSMKESQMSNDQLKKYQVRITELDHEIQTLNVEIDRQKNIRTEQENKIQVLITNITDYESRLHILEQENARLENKLKRGQIVIDKPSDQYIVNQLLGQPSQVKREIITTTTNNNVVRQSGTSYGQTYFDQQRLPSQNEIKQSQFGRMLSPQPQVSNYLSPDKYQQTQKVTTTKSVKQAIMNSGQG